MRSAAESVHVVAATAGFLSFLLLWLAVMWGMILRNGWASTRIRHSTVQGIHQTVALLGLCLGVVHTVVQLAVPDGTVRVVDTLVPFLNRYDPIGIGVGAVALELTIAATLSVLIQRRLGYTRWRALHAVTYAAFILLVAHVLISGSDVDSVWAWGSVLGAWLVTVVLWFMSTVWALQMRRSLAERGAAKQRGQEFTVNVDAQRCARFGFCEQEAPDLFRLRSDGRLTYRSTVPADSIEAVVRAVEVCPARAIALVNPPTTILTLRRLEPVPDTAPRNGSALTDTGSHRRVPPRRGGRS